MHCNLNDIKMNSFTESNRWKHFLLEIPCSFIGTILFGLGLSCGMEFKDCQADPANAGKSIFKWSWKNWDWKDFGWSTLGALVGQVLQIGLILLFI